jgi:hypothetical protein
MDTKFYFKGAEKNWLKCPHCNTIRITQWNFNYNYVFYDKLKLWYCRYCGFDKFIQRNFDGFSNEHQIKVTYEVTDMVHDGYCSDPQNEEYILRDNLVEIYPLVNNYKNYTLEQLYEKVSSIDDSETCCPRYYEIIKIEIISFNECHNLSDKLKNLWQM